MIERAKQDYKIYYDILDTIGIGHYGTVFKGKEKETNELRAIKVMELNKIRESLSFKYKQSEIEAQLNFSINGFIKEFEIMQKCSNNNINSVRCYEYFNNQNNFVIIMDLCDKNLSQLLIEKKEECKRYFNSEEILEIMEQLNNTFKIMRDNAIIHRNLKLENILIKKENGNNIIKLTDYGCRRRIITLLKNYGKESNEETVAYIAPEILKGEKYDYKIDLWSIGIIMFRLNFGISPFSEVDKDKDNLNKYIEKFENESLKKTENEKFDDLIKKLLEKDPSKRLKWDEYLNHGFFKDNIIILNRISLIYECQKDYSYRTIFGSQFVENNKDKIELIINGERSELVESHDLKKGENKIEILIKKEITNLEHMFDGCEFLKNIEELKYLDTKKITNFSNMFNNCNNLSDLKPLQNWNVSNGKDFSYMFRWCHSLTDLKPLEKWKVSKGNNFSYMFYQCKSLKDITDLENWDVFCGKNFSYMFSGCGKLPNLKGVENWDVSNGNNFSYIFNRCRLLSDIKALENWNVSNGENFSFIFNWCESLKDIKALEKWNFSNGKNFSGIFYGCGKLSDIEVVKNWNVSNGEDFSEMFSECKSLKDIKALEKWNVSNGNNFSFMFRGCESLSNINSLENWNVSKGNNFSYMFFGCKLLSNIKALEKWNFSIGNNNNFTCIFKGCKSDLDKLKNLKM